MKQSHCHDKVVSVTYLESYGWKWVEAESRMIQHSPMRASYADLLLACHTILPNGCRSLGRITWWAKKNVYVGGYPREEDGKFWNTRCCQRKDVQEQVSVGFTSIAAIMLLHSRKHVLTWHAFLGQLWGIVYRNIMKLRMVLPILI